LLVCQTAACVLEHSATLRWREGGQELGFAPMLDLSVRGLLIGPSLFVFPVGPKYEAQMDHVVMIPR
jgi:hypothetical protein